MPRSRPSSAPSGKDRAYHQRAARELARASAALQVLHRRRASDSRVLAPIDAVANRNSSSGSSSAQQRTGRAKHGQAGSDDELEWVRPRAMGLPSPDSSEPDVVSGVAPTSRLSHGTDSISISTSTSPACLLRDYHEQLPWVSLPHAPLYLPEVGQQQPTTAAAAAAAVTSADDGPSGISTSSTTSATLEFPDVVLLESWLNAMLGRAGTRSQCHLQPFQHQRPSRFRGRRHE